MKPGRQSAILDIIAERDIETQHQLLQALAERGVKSTQATLSRDIHDMHLTKEAGPDGGYRYAAVRKQDNDHFLRLQKIFKESVISFDIAHNLFVIRTLPGLASAACSAMDAIEVDGLVGTIAGDDTAFLAMKDNASAQALYSEIRNLF